MEIPVPAASTSSPGVSYSASTPYSVPSPLLTVVSVGATALVARHYGANRRAAAVRLSRLGAVEIEQSLVGRLLGYGTIVAGDLEIDYVPEPRRVYGLVERLSG